MREDLSNGRGIFDARNDPHRPLALLAGFDVYIEYPFQALSPGQSGQPQVYVRRFPGDEEIIVSSGRRASGPIWSQDGTELFFLIPEKAKVL